MLINYRKFGLITVTAGWLLAGCNKFVDVPSPETFVDQNSVFQDDINATALMTGVYARMSAAEYPSGASQSTFVSSYGALSADELTIVPAVTLGGYYRMFYENNVTTDGQECWGTSYNFIYAANAVIDGLRSSPAISSHVKMQLEGEARFIRAYNYFYLVNCYGDVPLTTTSNYKENNMLLRTDKEKVYQQVISDLSSAIPLLADNFVALDLKTVTTERVRPNRYAAWAMLARTYLYHQQFDSAELAASAVIDRDDLYDTVSLDQTFLMNNKETIWSLQPIGMDFNTEEARKLIIPSSGFDAYSNPFYLNPSLLDSFETGDRRRMQWVGKYTDITVTPNVDYYYPYKYKSNTLRAPLTEYRVELRLSEQYLIRAEARARQGKTALAAADLNLIRHKAGLPNTTATTPDELVAAVMHERQLELFMEGHRWFDLKRTGTVDAVMSVATPLKGGTWASWKQLYPVPLGERRKVPGLTQNAGY